MESDPRHRPHHVVHAHTKKQMCFVHEHVFVHGFACANFGSVLTFLVSQMH